MRRYNQYVKKNELKHSDKNLIKFQNATTKGGELKKENNVLNCYWCGVSGT